MIRTSHLLIVAGVFAGVALLALAVSRLDLQDVGAAMRSARLWPYLPLALLAYAAGHVCRGIRLRRLVSGQSPLTTQTATNVVLLGYAANNVLPARLGELARAWMLTERSGLSFAQSITVTLFERLLDLLALVVLLGVTALLLPPGWGTSVSLGLAVTVLAVAMLVVLVGIAFPEYVRGVASRVASRVFPGAHDAVLRQVTAVLNGLAYARRPGAALRVGGLSLAVWLCEAGLFLAMLPAFGLPARPLTALLAMTTANLGSLIPSTPGFIGTFHFFCMQALVSTGVPPEVAFGYAVLVHLTFFVPVTVWGLGVLASHGLSVGRALALSREAQPLSSLPAPAGATPHWSERRDPDAEPQPSRFALALSEAACPFEEDGLTGATRREAVREVASFVEGQLLMLPVRLRVLMGAGLWGFRAATAVVHGRGYCDLPEPLRRSWFEAWAYGRAGLARQLFRAVRSTALLAYYERPEVRAALAGRATSAGAEDRR